MGKLLVNELRRQELHLKLLQRLLTKPSKLHKSLLMLEKLLMMPAQNLKKINKLLKMLLMMQSEELKKLKTFLKKSRVNQVALMELCGGLIENFMMLRLMFLKVKVDIAKNKTIIYLK